MKLLGSAVAPRLAAQVGRTLVQGSLLLASPMAGLGSRDRRRLVPRAMAPFRQGDLHARTVASG